MNDNLKLHSKFKLSLCFHNIYTIIIHLDDLHLIELFFHLTT